MIYRLGLGPILFFAILGAFLFLAPADYAKAESAADTSPNRFGLSLVLTGPWAPWGTPIKNGALLAAKHSRHSISLDVQDDRCEARGAMSNLQKFQAFDGHRVNLFACVETIDAVAPVAKKSNGIIIALGGMTKDILNRHPNVTNFFALAENEVSYLIPYWTQKEHFKRLAIIRGNWTYGEAFGGALENAAKKAGITVTLHEAVGGDLTDYRSLFLKLMGSKPDVVFIHQAPESLGLAFKQLRELGFTGAIYSGFYAEYAETKKTAGVALEGVRFTSYSDPHGDPETYAQFEARFKAEFGIAPNQEAGVGYDAVQLLDRALDRCTAQDSECIQKQLRQVGSYRGVSGKVELHPDGSATRPFGIKEYRNGQYVWVAQEIKLN